MSDQAYIRLPRAAVSNPLDDLRSKLHQDQDRRDRLAIRVRGLVDELTSARAELGEVDLSIRATRGLLALADAAQKQAADKAAKTEPTPATTTRKRNTK